MTDQPKTSSPTGMIALTGLGSSAMGDQIGDALAKILAWIVAVDCQCAPPPEILSAFHTLIVALVVGISLWVHSRMSQPSA